MKKKMGVIWYTKCTASGLPSPGNYNCFLSFGIESFPVLSLFPLHFQSTCVKNFTVLL